MRRTIPILVLLPTLAACGGGGGKTTAETPTFTPRAGTYATAQSITIGSATAGAAIYYTTDGSIPTTASTRYDGPVVVTTSMTVKALATASGRDNSAVASAEFVIDASATPAEAPTFDPPGGFYTSSQSVTLATTTADASIYYTTDGSTPSTASLLYTGAVSVASSVTLKAIAAGGGHTPSAVATAAYIIGGRGAANYMAFCNAMNEKFISLWETCWKANPDSMSKLQGLFDSCSSTQNEIDKGLIVYNAANGEACKAAFEALGCDVTPRNYAQMAACGSMLTGTVATGAACYSSKDCQSGYCTRALSSETCPGICKPFATLGGMCTTSEMCARGQACSNNKCTTLSAVEGACPCQAGLWCDTSGVCKAQLATASPCSPSTSDQCAPGLVCVGSPATCKPYAGLGEDCTPASPLYMPTECALGYYCDSTTSKCAPYPHVGESCKTIGICSLSAYCGITETEPTCKARVALGGDCTMSLECDGICNSQTHKCESLSSLPACTP